MIFLNSSSYEFLINKGKVHNNCGIIALGSRYVVRFLRFPQQTIMQMSQVV